VRSAENEIEKALANAVEQRAVAVVIGGDAYLLSRREQISALALRHAIPTMFPAREAAVAGGLMSYGSNQRDMYRQAGVYVGPSSRARGRPICRLFNRPSSSW